MASAFAHVIEGLFGDPNIARDAVYIDEGGTQRLVRVVTRRADEVTGFGVGRLWSETTRLDLRAAEVPQPRPAIGSRSRARPSSSRASQSATVNGWCGPWTCGQREDD